jgi:hypothetical protein
MPHWLKRFLFLLFVGVVAWVEGVYLAPYGFGTVAVALSITVILAVGWISTSVSIWLLRDCSWAFGGPAVFHRLRPERSRLRRWPA